MQYYATGDLVKEDFTLHSSITKRRTESMKYKFLTSFLFKFLYNSNLKGVYKKWEFLIMHSWKFIILKRNFLKYLL